jgi:hypothetical protein
VLLIETFHPASKFENNNGQQSPKSCDESSVSINIEVAKTNKAENRDGCH